MPVRVVPGTRAIAEAVKLADADVISAYPIRPYTGVMNALAKMLADGDFDAEYHVAVSEHDQFEIAKHASVCGARVFTGSSGTGWGYAYEAIYVTSLGMVPVVAMIGCRALDDPGNFGMEHNDAFSTRDLGWMTQFAQDAQEALDLTLIGYRVAEDHRVLIPWVVAVDGFGTTHVASPVDIPTKEQVEKFLPPYKPPYPLDPAMGPITRAQHVAPSLIGPEQRKQVDAAMKNAKKVIAEAYEDFAKIFGRTYPPFIEEFMMDDAETAFIVMGAYAKNLKTFVKKQREKGEKVGVVRIKSFRPFPTEELQQTLSKVKAVGVFDFDFSFGSPDSGGVVFHEVKSALYDSAKKPNVINYICAGGRDVLTEHFEKALELAKEATEGKPEKTVHWLTLRGPDI